MLLACGKTAQRPLGLGCWSMQGAAVLSARFPVQAAGLAAITAAVIAFAHAAVHTKFSQGAQGSHQLISKLVLPDLPGKGMQTAKCL